MTYEEGKAVQLERAKLSDSYIRLNEMIDRLMLDCLAIGKEKPEESEELIKKFKKLGLNKK